MGRKRLENARSAIVTLRFEPKNKYLAEIAARLEDRSLNRLVETALEGYLKNEAGEYRQADLWSPDPVTRFEVLASKHPDLLTVEEEAVWQRIRNDRRFSTVAGKLKTEAIRDAWEELAAVGQAAHADMRADLTRSFVSAQKRGNA